MSLSAARTQDAAAHFQAWLDEAAHHRDPFDFWLLDNVLPLETVRTLAALPCPAPDMTAFPGRREANNASRLYFTRATGFIHPVIRATIATFADPATISRLAALTGADLHNTRLRIEYCQDTDGFWLEPHCDIAAKRFTMLIYLSSDPALFDAGTDIFTGPPAHRLAASVPYIQNTGLIFIPGHNTWHGFAPRPLYGLRKTLIINYVTRDWRATEELAT